MTDRFLSLGLMSGTSMDGIDASVINSNGIDDFKPIYDKFYPYDQETLNDLISIRDKINNIQDLKIHENNLRELERKITIIHAKISIEILKKYQNIDLIGFHGQTIYHDADQKISRQLADAKLLSQMTKKRVVYEFRKNDINNGGQGAPLTPIFHLLLKKNLRVKSIIFLNIGGIANETLINHKNDLFAKDLGPGNCLIDQWIKINSKKFFDYNGNIARSGKVDKLILNQGLDIFLNSKLYNKTSYDIKDFDLSFSRGLSLEDGAATLTEFTAEILSKKISGKNIYSCGGGRKNSFLIERIEDKLDTKINQIEKLDLNGDFIESQAFAFLAIRTKLNLPISFPETTGCKKPLCGGILIKNF